MLGPTLARYRWTARTVDETLSPLGWSRRDRILRSLAHAAVPDGPVTVMCGHGERAMTGASILTRRGHRDVTVLDGGPDTWAASSGEPLVVGR